MLSRLLLNSGEDIPFEEASLIIHPPKIKEISMIGENAFWRGAEFLNFSKDYLGDKDKNDLTSISDFEILMMVIQNQSVQTQIDLTQMEFVLALMFPNYKMMMTPQSIIFVEELEDGSKENHLIDKDNFDVFKKYLNEIFCLSKLKGQKGEVDYNPAGSLAKALADKFKARRKKLAEIKNKKGDGVNILDLYMSILSVGLQKDKNVLKNYTVYQLFDEFERFSLNQAFDMNIRAKLAGATKIKDAENWMKDFQSESD